MPNQAVVSGVVGPGRSAVATPIANLTELHINFNDRRLQLHYDNAPNFTSEFELTNTTTITIANNAGNFTVTVA